MPSVASRAQFHLSLDRVSHVPGTLWPWHYLVLVLPALDPSGRPRSNSQTPSPQVVASLSWRARCCSNQVRFFRPTSASSRGVFKQSTWPTRYIEFS